MNVRESTTLVGQGNSVARSGAGTEHQQQAPAPEVPRERGGAAGRGGRWARIWPWLVGLALGVVVLGPALEPGALLSLDLVLTDDVPVPRGVWGLGPELPRRVPLFVPAAWLSPLIDATVTVKVMMVLAVAVAFVGAFRLVAARSEVAAIGAGLLFALSPFMLTRLAAGHLHVVVATAILPWAYPRLLRPCDDIARTLLWCAALGFAGNYGGLLAAMVVLAGLIATRFARWPAVTAAFFVGQLPWFVPGLFVFGSGASLTDATPFATRAPGIVGYGEVLAGHGFWQPHFQIGGTESVPAAVAGVLLVGLAVWGTPLLSRAWRVPATVLGVVGIGIVYASAVPGVSSVFVALSRSTLGSNLRESQRLFPLFLVWLAPAAALGAWRAAAAVRRRFAGVGAAAVASIVLVVPCAVALVLGGPGLWGVGGHLCPITLPADWAQARSIVRSEPGTVIALPWFGYVNQRFCDTQIHVLNPWPIYLGGDVMVASDFRMNLDGRPAPERADPRDPIVEDAVRAMADGVPPSSRFAEVGARWVVFNRVDRYLPIEQVLDADPGLERVAAGKHVFVYRVRDWPGEASDRDGNPVAVDRIIEPLATVPASTGAFEWRRAAAPGWLRGLRPTGRSPSGLVDVPADGGAILWYWPAVVVLAADVVTVVAVGVAGWRAWRGRRRAGEPRQSATDTEGASRPTTSPDCNGSTAAGVP